MIIMSMLLIVTEICEVQDTVPITRFLCGKVVWW